MKETVSVLIPTFNRKKYLREAIKSALNQTYSNIEIIISDNCSTDNTYEVVQEFKDKRIKYYRNKTNIGPILNWKNALEKSCGKYCVILCDDDYFIDENYIEDAIKIFQKHKTINLVITDCVLGKKTPINTDICLNQIVEGKDFLYNFWSRNYYIPVISNVFVREKAIELDAFNDNTILYSDIELWLKLMTKGDVGYINKQSVYYSFHNDNIVTNMSKESIISNSKFILNLKKYLNKSDVINQDECKELIYKIVNKYILFFNSIYHFYIDINLYKRILDKVEINYNDNYYLDLKNKLSK